MFKNSAAKNKMAKRSSSSADLFCNTCCKQFKHQSKFTRHLESTTHQRFSQSLQFHGPGRDDSVMDLAQEEPALQELDFTAENIGVDYDQQDVENIGFNDDEEEDVDNIGVDDDFEDSSESGGSNYVDELFTITDDSGQKDFYPFESGLHAYAFMLVNGSRPMGEENLKFIFHIIHQISSNPLSFSSIKKFTLPGFIEPSKHYSSKGIPFYVNYPSTILRRCLGTLEFASNITRFPVLAQNRIEEVYHGSRWMHDQRFSTPMIASSVGQVFIGDFVKCSIDQQIVLARVKLFYKKESYDEIMITVIPLLSEEDFYCISDEKTVLSSSLLSIAPAPLFIRRWNGSSYSQLSQEEYNLFTTPHPLKEKASGRPIVMVPIILFTDDTSGNRSKQWNKFDSWCVRAAGLPVKENSKLYNLHLICCSNKCDVMDMAQPIVEDLFTLEVNGILSYDAHLECEVLLVAPVLCIIADNPRHSEIMNHSGSSALHYCRMCMAKRDDKITELPPLRNKAQTLRSISEINSQSTEKGRTACKVRYGVTTTENPFFKLPLDLHRSTPIEVLHTILLGPFKYLLRLIIPRLSSKQRREVQSIVSAFNFSGFKVKIRTNIIKHYKSFVGRDFKALAQCALFIFRDYFTLEEKRVWLALCKVFKMVYCDSFVKGDESLCREICKEFVQTVYADFPDFGKKVKIHLILHLVDSIVDYGPTCGFNTERCEAFNSLLRSRNIYANRLAPSRDIARGFEIIGHLRSICGGNNFQSSRRIGKDLIDLYKTPHVQTYLNSKPPKEVHSSKDIYHHGTLRKLKTKKKVFGSIHVSLMELGNMTVTEVSENSSLSFLCPDVSLDQCVYEYGGVMDANSMLIHVGDFIEYHDQGSNTTQVNREDIGLLVACFMDCNRNSYCLVRPLQYLDTNGETILNEYDCPVLTTTDLVYCIASDCVHHAISVVHECTSACTFVNSSVSKKVEHETVSVFDVLYQHNLSNKLYCYNVYCMCLHYYLI